MYHALAVEDFLDLINICEKNRPKISENSFLVVNTLRSIVNKMLVWLSCMSHPDGKISFFNDAAFDVAPSNLELFKYAKRLSFQVREPVSGVTDLSHSGFIRLQSDSTVLIADLGEIGPNYLPGHAHADTLSFEFSICNERIFVNSGTSEYGVGEERQRQRGTSAHNSVCVAGKNSSEVWSGFRVGGRAKITRRVVGHRGDAMYAMGEHDGYSRENNGLRHSREFFLNEKSLIIKDIISVPAYAEARFHCHPDLKIKQRGQTDGTFLTANGTEIFWIFSGVSQVNLVKTTWHPEFGISLKNQCLVAQFEKQNCEFILKWN